MKNISKPKKKEKIGRNDPCPCGSGLKYKKCCMLKAKQKSMENMPLTQNAIRQMYYQKHKIRLKEPKDIEGIRKAGQLVRETFREVENIIKPGLPTEAINTVVHEFTLRHGAIPAPLNYRGFPKSVCVSVNEVICHGIPGDRILQDGDIVNVDITSILDGYYADCNRTFFVGTPGAEARKIVHVARESLQRGMAQVQPGKTLGDIGWAIQSYAENEGCSVVREFVGHGVGFDFHEPPQVCHYGNKGEGIVLVPGMVFTIEPMINLGKKELRILSDQWTAVTKDGSLSAQFEQTLLVTGNGCESLTPFDE
jgi:methionyl aminopeptidase